ncbi:MAG: DNA mismatch repair protein MutS, partial [Bacteroidales bacterium]|nr:DNA mismatch repair protein MutS [Bacteroidales bacterium]
MKIKEAIEYIGGFKYVINALNIHSSAGSKILYALPFLKVSEEIAHETEKTEWLIDGMNEESFSQKVALTQMKLSELRDINNTISRLRYNNTLDDIELFEVKHLAILAHSIDKEVRELKLPFIAIPDLSGVIEILDPQGKKIPQFYIYNEYSSTLSTIRSEINKITHSNETEEEVNKLRLKEKEEENKIRVVLTEKLHPYTEELKNALNEMATLDLLIAKANLAKELLLTKPTFAQGVTSLSGLFNPEIYNSLQKHGKKFQPVNISIPSDPTLITGANMTGKTV